MNRFEAPFGLGNARDFRVDAPTAGDSVVEQVEPYRGNS